MGIKRAVHFMLSMLGYGVTRSMDGSYKIERLLRLGVDPIADVRRILRSPVESVFDVGANIGQSALKFAAAFPRATIWSFEPGEEAHDRLRAATANIPAVHVTRAAVGRARGTATLHRSRFNETNSLRATAAGAAEFVADRTALEAAGSETVEVLTVDEFCVEHGIERIDLLKIDTQGYEIEVLEGARRLLSRAAVALIYAEVSFVPLYESQPLFAEVYQFLYDRGYRLVGIYESGFHTHFYQVGGNALFVHRDLGERPRREPRFRAGRIAIQ